MKKRFTYEKAIGIIFCLVLAITLIVSIVMPDKGFSSEENRILQKKPGFSVSTYLEGRFETRAEDYTNDQFPFRNGFIKAKSAADLTIGKLESNGVFKGRKNYLLEDITVPDEGIYEDTKKALANFKKKYKDMDMYFLLAPNAANIMSDRLPATVRVADQNQYMDDFFKSIRKSGLTPIDVRKALLSAKEEKQVYYMTDHHWTTDGAYAAYRAALKPLGLKDGIKYESYVVKNDFRGTLASKSGFVSGKDDEIKIMLPKAGESRKKFKNSVIYYSDTKKKTTRFYEVDNLEKKDAYTVFGGSNHPVYTIRTPIENGDDLLLIKDSYANSMIPFLAQKYKKIVVVDPRYYYDDVNDLIKSSGIDCVMFLYNGNTFFQDDSLEMMLNN